MVSAGSKPPVSRPWLSLIFSLLLAALTLPASSQQSTCLKSWEFKDITGTFGGPEIEGTPAVLSWSQRTVGSRTDLWGRGAQGSLVHYWRVGTGGSGAWVGEVLPDPEDMGTLSSDPVAVFASQQIDGNRYDRLDVFLTNKNEELLHYWWSELPPARWHSENLTHTSGRPLVYSQPVVRNSYANNPATGHSQLRQDVYSVNLSRDLIQYSWEAKPGWSAVNLRSTTPGGGMSPFIRPAVNAGSRNFHSPDHHIFAPDASGHLSNYWRDAATSPRWNWQDRTQVGPGQFHSLLNGYPLAAVNFFLSADDRLSVFGFLGTSLIRYWHWGSGHPWNAENVTQVGGFNDPHRTLAGLPAATVSRQSHPADISQLKMRHDVWIRALGDQPRFENGHLFHYYASEPWSAYSTSGGVVPWQKGEDLTKGGRPVIQSDPVASIRYPFAEQTHHLDPSHYVFARNENNLVIYCWDRYAGWDASLLQAESSPTGDPTDGVPVIDDYFGPGLSVFARGANGHLLQFWK